MTQIAHRFKAGLLGIMAFLIGLLTIESIAMIVGEPRAIKPKSRLARFFYTSETARVPMMLGIAIILTPLALADAIHRRITRKG